MTPATESCPSCSQIIPAGVQFCPECGAIVVRGGEKREERLGRSFDMPPGLFPPDSGTTPKESRPVLALIPAAVLVALALVAFLLWPSEKPATIPVPGEPAAEPSIGAIAEAPAPKPTARPRPTPPPAAVMPPSSARAPVDPPAVVEEPREPESYQPPPEEAQAEEPQHESPTLSTSRSEPAASSPPHAGRPPSVDGESSPPATRWYRVRFRAPLFAQPSETAAILSYLPAGTRIRVTRRTEGFLAVESVTGKQPGYLSRDDAIPESVAGAR